MTSATVRSADGTTIAYEVTGTGPAVILVDAAGQFRGTGGMRELAEQLAGELTVYCYDRRGRGESTDTRPYAVDREVEDLRALVEVAGGSAAVYGFSSGAVLALHTAAAEPGVSALVLFEPALDLDAPPLPHGEQPELATEVTDLVEAGRRGDAYLHFLRSVGVPQEYVDQTTQSPVWDGLQALAHTLAYDLLVTSSMTEAHVRSVGVPTLVVNSADTGDNLRVWGERVAATLPNATHRMFPGGWHGVAPELVAPAVVEHVTRAPVTPRRTAPRR